MTDKFIKKPLGKLEFGTVYRCPKTEEYGVAGRETPEHLKNDEQQIVDIIVPSYENEKESFMTFDRVLLIDRHIEITLDSYHFRKPNFRKLLCEYIYDSNSYQIIVPDVSEDVVEFYVIGTIRFRSRS